MHRTFGLFLAGLLGAGIPVSAEVNWPQFRGSASGVADMQAPPTELEKAQKWKVAVPSGASSPCIVGDRLFLTGYEAGKLYTLAYARTDGKLLWKQEAPATKIEEFHKTEGSPAASTPVSDGKVVVAYFGSCGLVAYDLAGKELWKVSMPMAVTNNSFGSGTSPILADGLVVLQRDLSADSMIAAYRIADGTVAWKKPREGFTTSYGSPYVWEHDGLKEVIACGATRMKAYDLKTGDERWTVGNVPAVACTTPVAGDGLLYFAGWAPGGEDFKFPAFDDLLKMAEAEKVGYIDAESVKKTFLKDFFENNDTNKDGKITRDEWDAMAAFLKKGQNVALAIKPGGKGDITLSHVVWRQVRGLPYVPSPLYYQGKLFLIKDGGLATLLDAKTGKPTYVQERIGASGPYYASPVAAGGHIYVTSLDGTISVLKGSESPEVVSRIKLGETTKATPAIVDDMLYVRTNAHLYAFGK